MENLEVYRIIALIYLKIMVVFCLAGFMVCVLGLCFNSARNERLENVCFKVMPFIVTPIFVMAIPLVIVCCAYVLFAF